MKHLLTLILLAGCVAVTTPAPMPAEDTCNAASYATLLGAPATALERVLLLGKVRVIRPDQAVTLDFLPDRINFMVDEDGRIARITCG
ncbi:I78 family peptidase inhibitor [Yoonia sp.]|uniref:I78 family peptidase inhibitor n=1 Tax=Yoonia sp. TaxID=2212373 RepID=UPI0023B4870A